MKNEINYESIFNELLKVSCPVCSVNPYDLNRTENGLITGHICLQHIEHAEKIIKEQKRLILDQEKSFH